MRKERGTQQGASRTMPPPCWSASRMDDEEAIYLIRAQAGRSIPRQIVQEAYLTADGDLQIPQKFSARIPGGSPLSGHEETVYLFAACRHAAVGYLRRLRCHKKERLQPSWVQFGTQVVDTQVPDSQ